MLRIGKFISTKPKTATGLYNSIAELLASTELPTTNERGLLKAAKPHTAEEGEAVRIIQNRLASTFFSSRPATHEGITGFTDDMNSKDEAQLREFLNEHKVSCDILTEVGSGTGRLVPLWRSIASKKATFVEPDPKLVAAMEKNAVETQGSCDVEFVTALVSDYLAMLKDVPPVLGQKGAVSMVTAAGTFLYLSDEQIVGLLKRYDSAVVKEDCSMSRASVDATEMFVPRVDLMLTNPELTAVKEGTVPVGLLAEYDGSIVRSKEHFEALFKDAGMAVVGHKMQWDVPGNMFSPLSTWFLRR